MEKAKSVKKIAKKVIFLALILALTLVVDAILAFAFATNNYYLNNVVYKIAINLSYGIFPLLFIPLLFKKHKKKIYIGVIIYILLVTLLLVTSIVYEKREESLVIKTDVNIDVNEYLPFTNNSKIVKLRENSIIKT